jgi:GNAT superfamily N-acetyltransferase
MFEIIYKQLTPEYYKQAIELGNSVHGDGYLNEQNIADWVSRGILNNLNSSYVALINDCSNELSPVILIGFRITFAAQNWQADQWCSPDLWQVPKNKCCYFKCNTVNEKYRGLGVGKKLLQLSVDAAKNQGSLAGISHLWKQSPNNSAVAYFTRCGGELVKSHPEKWNEESKNGYDCILCGHDCHCEAAEMIIRFEDL